MSEKDDTSKPADDQEAVEPTPEEAAATDSTEAEQPGQAADDLAAADDPEQRNDGEIVNDSPAAEIPLVAVPLAAPAKSRQGIAWLALILALGAAALSGYEFWRNWRVDSGAADTRSSLASLQSRTAATASLIDEQRARIDSLEQDNAALNASLKRLPQTLDTRLELVESLPGRVKNVEGSMAALQGISSGVRDTWLLAESEYYMQLANAQLQLAGNPELASLALSLADERVRELADPGLTAVRRALADEMQALNALGKPDIEGVTLALASLASDISDLPLAEDIVPAPADAVVAEEEASGMARAWNAVKGAVSSAVSVRKSDDKVRPLMPPEAQFFLRTNLELQLETARLSLLRGEQSSFRQSLDDATNWIDRYFDTDDDSVKAALATIAGIRDSELTVAAPDISESLRLLRQYNALHESDQ